MQTMYISFHGSLCTMTFMDHAAAQVAYDKISAALAAFKAFSRNECADTVEVTDGDGNPATYRLERMDAVMVSGSETEEMLRERVRHAAMRRKVYEEFGVPYPERSRRSRGDAHG